MKTAVMEQFGEPLKVHADWGFSGTSRYPHLVGDGAGGSGVLEYRPTGWPTESTEKLFWRRQSAPNQALHLTDQLRPWLEETARRRRSFSGFAPLRCARR